MTPSSSRLQPDAAPWLAAPETRAVVAALAAGGRAVRFVGGCVRDALLGRAVMDVDLATPEPPARVLALLAAANIKAVPTGVEHGTVTAVSGGRPFEITTLRRDVTTDGRRAVVAFTDDWSEDAARRDFTINALSADPDGTVHDPFGGMTDLQAGRVRFVGDAETRIREDVLRILRFFRFHAHYGQGTPDAAGLAACSKLAALLPTLSAERIAAELLKLLAASDAATTLALMRKTGILTPVVPEIENIPRLRALQDIPVAEARDPLLRLAAVLPEDATVVAAVADRLRLSNEAKARLAGLADPPRKVWPARDARALRRALYRLGPLAGRDLALLTWAGGDAALGRAAYAASAEWMPLQLPIRGQDALDLGVAPGPAVGQLIAAVEAWWEENDYRPDAAACRAKLKELVESRRA